MYKRASDTATNHLRPLPLQSYTDPRQLSACVNGYKTTPLFHNFFIEIFWSIQYLENHITMIYLNCFFFAEGEAAVSVEDIVIFCNWADITSPQLQYFKVGTLVTVVSKWEHFEITKLWVTITVNLSSIHS